MIRLRTRCHGPVSVSEPTSSRMAPSRRSSPASPVGPAASTLQSWSFGSAGPKRLHRLEIIMGTSFVPASATTWATHVSSVLVVAHGFCYPPRWGFGLRRTWCSRSRERRLRVRSRAWSVPIVAAVADDELARRPGDWYARSMVGREVLRSLWHPCLLARERFANGRHA